MLHRLNPEKDLRRGEYALVRCTAGVRTIGCFGAGANRCFDFGADGAGTPDRSTRDRHRSRSPGDCMTLTRMTTCLTTAVIAMTLAACGHSGTGGDVSVH